MRALTRKPDSDPARALDERGAEVVRADLDDPESVERDFNEEYCASRDVGLARELNPDLMSFEDWAAAYADRIPLE